MRPFLAAALLLSAAAVPPGRPPAGAAAPPRNFTRYEFSSRQMATEARIVLFAPGEDVARDAASRAFERVAALDAVMSDYREDSELTRLCRQSGGSPVRVSDDLFRVLEISQHLARETSGAFDVTAGPLTHLWRRARRRGELPDPDDLRAALSRTGAANLILNAHDRTVRLTSPQMQIDLGGIGKGFAADEAAAVLKKLGYRNSLVALGGDIVAAGAPPGAAGWSIDVATLDARKPGMRIVVRDAAVSTSGDAEQSVEVAGIRYSHIVDPRTGQALTGRRSVTVIAPRGALSDGLATGVSVLGSGEGLRVVSRFRGAAASISVASDGEIQTVTSPRWRDFAPGSPPTTGSASLRSRTEVIIQADF